MAEKAENFPFPFRCQWKSLELVASAVPEPFTTAIRLAMTGHGPLLVMDDAGELPSISITELTVDPRRVSKLADPSRLVHAGDGPPEDDEWGQLHDRALEAIAEGEPTNNLTTEEGQQRLIRLVMLGLAYEEATDG